MSEKINVIESAIDYRLGMLIRGMNNELILTDEKSRTRTIPLHVLIQDIKDDLVIFVGEEESKYHINENDVKVRIEYQVKNVLNAVKVHFTDTDMILTIQEVT